MLGDFQLMKIHPEEFSAGIPGILVLLLVVAAILREMIVPTHLSIGDLGAFIESARAIKLGLNPYAEYPLGLSVQFPGFDLRNINLNPPFSLILFQVFTFFDAETTARIWFLVNVLLYLGLIRSMVKQFPAVSASTTALWMLAFAPFWDTLRLGQIYIPLMAAGMFAWICIGSGQRFSSGILVGFLVALKPQFAVWPILLLLARHYASSLTALCTTGILTLLSLVLVGPSAFGQWLQALNDVQERIPFLTNASLPGLFSRVGLYSSAIFFAVTIGGCYAIWAMLKRPSSQTVSTHALIFALCFSPLAWMHYSLLLIPFFLNNWGDHRIRALALLLVVPVPAILSVTGKSMLAVCTVGSLYSWVILLLFMLNIWRQSKDSDRANA